MADSQRGNCYVFLFPKVFCSPNPAANHFQCVASYSLAWRGGGENKEKKSLTSASLRMTFTPKNPKKEETGKALQANAAAR